MRGKDQKPSLENATVVNRRKNQLKRKRVLAVLGCVVVLMTALALMVPAISITKDVAEQTEGIDLQATPDADELQSVEGPASDELADMQGAEQDSSEGEIDAPASDEPSSSEPSDNAAGQDSASSGTSGSTEGLTATDLDDDKDGSDDATDKDDSKDSADKDEADRPAQEFKGEVLDGEGNVVMTVIVKAPKGAFPAGTEMKIEALDADSVADKVETAIQNDPAIDGTVKSMTAIDIRFVDKDGNEIEPAKNVEVRITSGTVADIESPVLVHVVDKSKDSAKGKTADAEVVKKVDVVDEEATDDTLKFKTNEFSPYVIVEMENLTTQVITASGETYNVTVSYVPEANIPEGAELVVTEIVEGDEAYAEYLDQVNGELGSEVGFARFFDITIMADGEAVQPDVPVSVSIELADATELSDGVQAVHFADEGGVEVLDANLQGETVSFTAESFSVYAVVDEGSSDNARMTVNFYGKNQTTPIATVYVKNGDTLAELEQIIYDPGAGDMGNNELFKGWIINKADYTVEDTSSAMDIEDIREWAEAKTIEEGDVVNVYAMIFKTFAVSFKDESQVTIHSEALLLKSSDTSTTYWVNVPYTPKSQDADFKGWYFTTPSGTGVNPVEGTFPTDTAGRAYVPNSTSVLVSDHVTFSVNAPEGYWLSFNENGRGATYTPPQFVQTGQRTQRPPDPSRQGYEFGGWYTNKECTGNQFVFGNTLAARTDLFAKWTAVNNAPYTVVIWTQNLDGDGYDFKEAIQLNGRTNTTINTVSQQGTGNNAYARVNGVNKQYTGFHLDRFDQNVTINPEGNSVLNVYYDRNEYTMTFQVEGAYTESSSTTSGNYYIPDGSGGYTQHYLTREGDHWRYDTGEYEYTYTPTTSSSGTQYGLVNGEYVQLTYYSYAWGGNPAGWYYGGTTWSRGTQYTGTRYTRTATPITATYSGPIYTYSSGWTTIKTITALYEQNIADNFPIVGTNGITYDNGERWKPQSNNLGWTEVMVFVETMPNESVTFRLDVATRPLKTMNYYVEALPTDTDTVTRGGVRYVLYNQISARYNGVTAEDFVDLDGFTKVAAAETVNGPALTPHSISGLTGQYYIGSTTQDQTIYFFYSRDKYDIHYLDGTYFDGYGNVLDEDKVATWGTEEGIYYQADISSYGKNGSNYYIPTRAGYTFGGWYADSTCTQEYNFNKMPKGGVTVYAKWVKTQYRVFLHPNVPESDNSLEWGQTDQQMNFRVNFGDKINGGSMVTGERSDYELIGWYTDRACTHAYNFDAFVLNDTTVTASYDKTVDMTDEMNKYGNIVDPATATNSDVDRYWITKKLDLYAKWRSKLEGANGIKVVYDATSEGTHAPTDPLLYLDNAEATAQAASTPISDKKQFLHWVVQEWDSTANNGAGGYVDTSTTVYPGDTFVVLKANSQIVVSQWVNPENDSDVITVTDPQPGTTPPDNTHTKIKTATYTVQLRAEYGDKDAPTPTHIDWYPNYGENEALHKDENLKINQAVDIQSAPTRDGYTFLGWARVEETTGHPVKDLTADDLFLKYEDGVFKAQVTQGSDAWTQVSKVAADERSPYHDMYAVWEKSYKVTVIKVVSSDWRPDHSESFTFTPTKNVHDVSTQGDPFALSDGQSKEVYTDMPKNSHFTVPETDTGKFNITVTAKYTDDQGAEHEISGLSNGSNIEVLGDTVVTVTNTRKTAPVVFAKKDKSGETPLTGATFSVLRYDESLEQYVAYTPITSFTIDSINGVLENLIEGKYKLVETQAPTGFVILDDTKSLLFTVNGDGTVTLDSGASTDVITISGPTEGKYTITIKNQPGHALPSTGGPGTAALTVIGVALIAVAAIMLITRRRPAAARSGAQGRPSLKRGGR